MRIDWYTKGVLTVIALLLAVIAIKQYVSPDAVVQAQGSFAGVEFAGSCAACFFDPKTGEISWYSGLNQAGERWRLSKLGAPLVKEK